MKALLGIDIGTSACKIVIIDTQGKILAQVRVEYPTSHPNPCWAHQDPSDWIRASIEGTRKALTKARLDGANVQALGLSGQMHTLVALDEQGEVLRPAILWCDRRSTPYVANLQENLGPELRRWTANPVNGTMTLPNLLWLRDHEPHIWKRLVHLLMPKDYVRYRLCGDIATDPSDASGTLLYNSHHCRWSSEVIKALKLPAHFLPLVRLPHSIAGYLDEIMAEHMGLCAGITVVTGAADVSCEALAAEVSEPGRGFIRLGTAGVVCATVNERILPTGGAACYNHALHGQWLIVTGTQACGSSLLWARNLFVDNAEKGFEQLTDLAAHAPPGSEGLLFLPHLSGERAPYWNANLTGQFIGIQLKHNRRHFARAVLEGVAYSLRDSLSDVPELDGCIQTYTLLGGASSNPLLCQILADVFSAPMFVRPWAEPALGAAILAGMGSGWLSDRPLSLAGNALVFAPDADRNAVYEAGFLRYRALHHPPNVIFM